VNAVIANFEDKCPSAAYRLACQESTPIVQGLEADETRFVVILRDPFNNLASKRRARPERGLGAARREAGVWIELAREYLGVTNYLPNKVVINFNRWFTDETYRSQISRQLNLDFDASHPEAQKARLAVPRGDGRSQFDGESYDGRANGMDVLNRWKAFRDDPEFLQLFQHQELIALSDRIFTVEGIDSLLCKLH
jgi:hypothetical protein